MMRTSFMKTICMIILGISLWGCGAGEENSPHAASQGTPHENQDRVSAKTNGPTAGSAFGEFALLEGMLGRKHQNNPSSDVPGTDEETSLSEEDQNILAFQQRIVTAGTESRNVLLEALNDPDPVIRLMALDGLESIVKWDTQARSSLEQFREQETEIGIRWRMADLLARPVDSILRQSVSEEIAN
jgi:hypothetical protein